MFSFKKNKTVFEEKSALFSTRFTKKFLTEAIFFVENRQTEETFSNYRESVIINPLLKRTNCSYEVHTVVKYFHQMKIMKYLFYVNLNS